MRDANYETAKIIRGLEQRVQELEQSKDTSGLSVNLYRYVTDTAVAEATLDAELVDPGFVWQYPNFFGSHAFAAGDWHSDIEEMGELDGFSNVGRLVKTGDFDDITTSQFKTTDFPHNVGHDNRMYLAFAAKWDEIPNWGDNYGGEWVVMPDPDPNKYQLYVLRSDAGAMYHGATQALVCDGSNSTTDLDTVDINEGDSWPNRTITFWFQADSVSSASEQMIWEEGGGTNGFNIYVDSGNLYVGEWIGGTSFGTWLSHPINSKQTYHVTLRLKDGALNTSTPDALKMYVDGVEVGSGDGQEMKSHSGNSRIGGGGDSRTPAGGNAGTNFVGLIGEGRIYNRALSTSEIATLAAGKEISDDSELVALWRLDGNVKDTSPYGGNAGGSVQGGLHFSDIGEYFRLYYGTSSDTGEAYIADPVIWREYTPAGDTAKITGTDLNRTVEPRPATKWSFTEWQ